MSVFKPVNPKQNFPQLEEAITKFWKANKIFEKSVDQRSKNNKYVFYDGPPFITGIPHYGSLLPSIAKDVVPRYWTMNGKRVERKWGWDCHGLPIENKVENKLELKNRREIESFGIQKFIDECYKYTTETSAEWEWYIDKIGRWVDFEGAYKTMDQDYMETVIWVFKQLWDKDMVYEGTRVSLFCTRCGTPVSNFEIAMDNSYEDMEDPAVTVKFPIKNAKDKDLEGASILAWTTTPWTLPSNRALVVDPEEDYAVIELQRKVTERTGVGVFLIDKTKNKALVLREKSKINGLIEGGIEENETEEAAIKREVLEETGYKDVSVVKKVGTNTFYAGTPKFNLILKKYTYFIAELNSNDKQKPTKPDSSNPTPVWIDLNNLDKALNWEGANTLSKLVKAHYEGKQVEELEYVEKSPFTAKAGETVIEKFVVAKKRVEAVFGELDNIKAIKTLKGKEIEGLSYVPPFDYFAPNENDLKIYSYEGMVTMDDGTGIVHSAPGFGEIDTEMGNKVGLTLMMAVNDEGKFIDQVKDYAGVYIKDADPQIIADLTSRNIMLKDERIVHRYPYCYRCHTPLIQKAQPSWFVKIQELKDAMLRANENINWVPDHLKYGRFKKGIDTAPDWCISRTRYWATPMPVWRCDKCKHMDVFGSRAEIEEKSGQKIVDLHRPKIDLITYPCDKCEGTMKRVPEVLDVWMDSGSMPYAQKHYPFENKEDFEANYPADFVVEYIAQTRAWFYTMHVVSTALFNSESFKNVITTGVIFGTDGRKMSKSYGNYPDPKYLLETYGAEPLRMYLMGSKVMTGDDINFDEAAIKDQLKTLILPLWNSYSFFVTYANIHNWSFNKEWNLNKTNNKLDIWMLAKLEATTRNIRAAMENYDIPAAAREYPLFVQDLSKWYIRRSRDRFNKGDKEAMDTLYYILVEFCKLLAPFMPFITEEIWQNLVVTQNKEATESIHLSMFPDNNLEFMEKSYDVLSKMDAVRDIVALGQSIRVESGIKVRQPLAEMEVTLRLKPNSSHDLEEWMKELIADELNIKTIDEDENPSKSQGWVLKTSEDGKLKVSVDTTITDELRREGLFREFTRTVQGLRKQAKLKLEDQIKLKVQTTDPDIAVMVDMYLDQIKDITNAEEVVITKSTPEGKLTINGLGLDITI